ncbi:MAG: hypothetical protein HY475_01245 [Candidatus Terrybacteria bacterium]|nr:hypothetical protein [Candidatus Terrybacteria bacterium]
MESREFAPVIARLRGDLRRLRSPAGYLRAGIPHYPGLFGRDSLISGWQVLNDDPSFARAALLRLATLQGRRMNMRTEEEPGKILHEYYEPFQLSARAKKWRVVLRWGSPYYGSVDATPLWLVVFHRYLQRTRDTAFRDQLWPRAISACRWIMEYADHNRDGFLDYSSHNPFALTHQAWKDSTDLGALPPPVAPVEVQGYAYAALRAFADLARTQNDERNAQEAEQRARNLRDAFLARFPYDDSFAFALDGQGRPAAWLTSNPGHLLFSGILDPAAARRVATRLFAEDFWTPYGIRTLSMQDARFDWQTYHRGSVWPHDNWFFWKGLQTIGDMEGATRIQQALLRAFYDLGGEITELYAVEPQTHRLSLTLRVPGGSYRPSIPQAWASGALLDMLTEQEKDGGRE